MMRSGVLDENALVLMSFLSVSLRSLVIIIAKRVACRAIAF